MANTKIKSKKKRETGKGAREAIFIFCEHNTSTDAQKQNMAKKTKNTYTPTSAKTGILIFYCCFGAVLLEPGSGAGTQRRQTATARAALQAKKQTKPAPLKKNTSTFKPHRQQEERVGTQNRRPNQPHRNRPLRSKAVK